MSAFVQTPALTKLICITCKKYLSHFPIHSHPSLGSICGRCSLENKKDFLRNALYEQLSEYQKFPCCYHSNGCLENLLPSEVPRHEKFCKFKKHSCPTKEYNSCDWSGFITELIDHFKLKHPTFLLNNGQFEIDLVKTHKENYLLPFGDELFVVTREADSKTNTFSCLASYIGGNECKETYLFILTLESGNHEYKHSLSQTLDTKIELHSTDVKNLLNNPTNIIAQIDIKENIDNTESTDHCDTIIDFERIRELECPVCFEYMVMTRIYQCVTGHSICGKCKLKLEGMEKPCPTCEKGFQNTQNFALERISYHYEYPCKNEKCNFVGKAKELKQHETTCIFGPFKCPLHIYEECDASMPLIEIYDHIVNNHYESLLEFDTVHVPFNVKEPDSECYVLKYAFRLFLLSYKYENNELYWSMQLIGPVDECVKFKFELDILDNTGNKNRVYLKSCCAPYGDQPFKSNPHLYLQYAQIDKLISDQLSYRVRILQE